MIKPSSFLKSKIKIKGGIRKTSTTILTQEALANAAI
jgi:hypothetical protein